jgi:hypothetical protein
MPSALVQSGSIGNVRAWLKERASVEAASDVWYSVRYLAQPSKINQYLCVAMV